MSAMLHSKKHGNVWVYAPIPCATGARHGQPGSPAVRLENCIDFTPGYKESFDCRGALDAPAVIPRGGIRADDFDVPAGPGRILIAHVYRDGTWS